MKNCFDKVATIYNANKWCDFQIVINFSFYSANIDGGSSIN